MKTLLTDLLAFHCDENGDIVQTGIVVGILAIVSVGALFALRDKIKDLFTKAGETLDEATNSSY